MAKSLQTRSKTIRRAIASYNSAAAAMTPSRPPLDWSNVSHYGLIEQYAMLKATNTDVSDKQWSQPIYREILKCRRRIARAKEEIVRCNIETRRLHTSIYDDTAHFKKVVRKLRDDRDAMHDAVKHFTVRRNGVHKSLLKRIQQIHALVGFTGDTSRGIRIGREVEDNHGELGDTTDNDTATIGLASLSNIDGDSSSDESGVESDDEFHNDVGGVENFIHTVRD